MSNYMEVGQKGRRGESSLEGRVLRSIACLGYDTSATSVDLKDLRTDRPPFGPRHLRLSSTPYIHSTA